MANAYLVTGIAGSGKTTIKQALTEKGYATFDVDDGLASWIDRETGEKTVYDPKLAPMTDKYDWAIDPAALTDILASADPIIICGSAHDLYQYINRFSAVFLLSYPDEQSIKQRLESRTNNDYGKAPGELESILGYWKSYENEYIIRNATTIDCMTPLDKVIERIENTILEN